jgi:hypothetical protein
MPIFNLRAGADAGVPGAAASAANAADDSDEAAIAAVVEVTKLLRVMWLDKVNSSGGELYPNAAARCSLYSVRATIAQLPLHTGAAPAYLLQRMWKLAGAVTMAVGPDEMLRRISDP